MDEIIVTIAGFILIAAIYWFFLMKKDEAVAVGDTVDIRVEGGYNPKTIQVAPGRPITLTFLRTDPSSCLEEVILPDFKIKRYLPLNKPVSVEIVPKRVGTYQYNCGMNMYHGTIKVQEVA